MSVCTEPYRRSRPSDTLGANGNVSHGTSELEGQRVSHSRHERQPNPVWHYLSGINHRINGKVEDALIAYRMASDLSPESEPWFKMSYAEFCFAQQKEGKFLPSHRNSSLSTRRTRD